MQSISLEYGDALFRLLKVKIAPNGFDEKRITHNHRFYEFHFAFKGSYNYTVADKQITLKKDQFLIIPPSTPHIAVSSEDTDYEFASLSLHLSRCEGTAGFYEYFKNILEQNSNIPIAMTRSLADKGRFLRVIGEQGGDKTNIIHDLCALKTYGSAFIYELFDAIDGYRSEGHILQKAEDTDRTVLLEELVNHHDLSLGEIAAEMGYSTRHTARIIKSIYGCNISEIRKKHIISN
jgi:hypothetical protein